MSWNDIRRSVPCAGQCDQGQADEQQKTQVGKERPGARQRVFQTLRGAPFALVTKSVLNVADRTFWVFFLIEKHVLIQAGPEHLSLFPGILGGREGTAGQLF